MRHPSARVLANRVNIYVAVASLDADRAPQYTYPTLTYSNEPCTVQPVGTAEDTESQTRVSQTTQFRLIFSRELNLSPRAQILWTDTTGTVRTMFVETGKIVQAGRGSAFTVTAQERL